MQLRIVLRPLAHDGLELAADEARRELALPDLVRGAMPAWTRRVGNTRSSSVVAAVRSTGRTPAGRDSAIAQLRILALHTRVRRKAVRQEAEHGRLQLERAMD